MPRSFAHQVFDGQDARAPQAARAFVAEQLDRWYVPESERDSAVQIVSELTSNAVTHSVGTDVFRVALTYAGHCLMVSVTDHGGTAVCLRAARPDDDEESGRGLFLVAALAKSWGWYHVYLPRAGATTVWAELALRSDGVQV